MSIMPVMVPCASEVTYVADVISSKAALESLLSEGHRLQRLLADAPGTAHPRFYLASLSPEWQMRAVAVRAGRDLVGIVYAKERCVLGWLTGVVYLDATLPGVMLAEEELTDTVLAVAMRSLITRPHVRALRMLVPNRGYEWTRLKAEIARMNVEVAFSSLHMHCILPLPGRYELFVSSLGQRSRRNFRYYRRRFEATDGEFVADMPLETFKAAASSLLQKEGTGTNARKTARSLSMISAVNRPMLCGLRANDGAWLSILGGWFDGSSAVVLFQMNNDKSYPRASLSIVMRGYVIDNLIRRGVKDVFFWAGVSEPLDRHALDIDALSIYMDKPGAAWRAVRSVVKATRDLLPPTAAYHASWLVPPSDRKANHSTAAPPMLPLSDEELD